MPSLQSYCEELKQNAAHTAAVIIPVSTHCSPQLDFRLTVSKLSLIKTDRPVLCHREEIREDRLESQRRLFARGCVLEPLVIWRDGKSAVLLDGFHRYLVAHERGITHWPTVELRGPLSEALDFAIKCNAMEAPRLRYGADAERAALVASIARGAPLRPDELKELGLGSDPPRADFLQALKENLKQPAGLRLQLSQSGPSERQKGKNLGKKPKSRRVRKS